MENDILAEFERIVSKSDDTHLREAKLLYIQGVATETYKWIKLFLRLDPEWQEHYPELYQWTEARRADIARQVSMALTTILTRELLGDE